MRNKGIKRAALSVSIFFLFCFQLLAQPANDNCSGAQSLGTLGAPGPCGAGVQNGATTTVSGTTVGATPENPYVTLAGCGMASPANSVWYTFVAPANGYGVTIAITGATFSNPNIALWQGNNCNSLVGVGCIVGAGPSATLTIPAGIVPGNTYYIQVTTNSTAASGTFNLSANVFQDCSNCLIASTLTETPLPVNGTYQPGQTVTFCFQVLKYTQVNQNWLHGVQLSFGCGWDLTTLTTNSPSSIGNCNPSSWAYYPAGITGGVPAVAWPPGFYFDGNCAAGPASNDGLPGNNFGDTYNGLSGVTITATGNQWKFCWTLKVKSGCPPCPDLTVTVNTSGDGESGNWSNIGCVNDPPTSFNALIACCPPTVASTSVTCFGGNNATATATPVSGVAPFSYLWSNGQTTQTATGLAAGNYTVTVTNAALCAASATVTITQPPPITATVSSAPAACSSATGSASVTAGGGTPGYTYSWSSGQTTATASGLAGGNYTVTVTDANGCTKTTMVTVPSTAGGTASILSSTNVSCYGGSNASATATMTGGTSPFTYSWSNGQTTSVTTGLSAGNYTVTVTDINGCTSTTTVAIIQPTALTTSVSSTIATCSAANGSATVNTSGGSPAYAYTWNNGQTTSTASGLGPGNYTVTVTDSKGCTTTATVTVTSTAGGTASILSSTNVSCFGGSNGNASAAMSGGTSPFTYSWNNGQSTSAINNIPSGNYSVTITDANGCTGTTMVTITQPPVLSATNSQTNVSCNGGNSGSASVNASGGTPNYSYLWTNAQTTSSATGLTAGNYSVTITDANGCVFSISFIIIQPPSITATTSSNNEICNQMNGTASITASGGTGTLTYQWNPSGQTTPTATGLAAGNYSVTVTDANNCTYTTVVTVNSSGGPTANAGPSASICFGNSTQLNASGGGNYSWIPTTALSSTTISNPVATPTSSTTYTVIVTDANGCTSAANVTVTVNPLPITNAGPDVSVCLGFSTTINASGGGNYLWIPSNGLSSTNISNPVATPSSTTTYSLTVTNASGCSSADMIIVTVNPKPVSNFSATTVCFNNPTVFTNQSTGGTSWNWNFGDGNFSTVQNPSHTYNSSGTYSVTLIATNSFGCIDSIKLNVVVNPLSFSNFSSNTVCIGNPTCFNDLTTISSGNITGWSWNFGDPNLPNNISNLQNPCVTYTAAGTYNVVLTATSNNNCQSTTILPVTVNPPPVAAFTAQNVCQNIATVFTDGSTGANQWAWNFGDGNYSSTQNPVHTYLGFGTYIVTLIVTSGGSCKDTITDTLTVYPPPVVNFSADSVCVGQTTSFSDLSMIPLGNIITWSWNFGDIASGTNNTSTIQNPTHVFSSAGTYNVTLTVSSNNGCVSTVTLQVIVYPLPVAAFSFAPSSPMGLTDLVLFTDLSTGSPVQWWWNFGDSSTATSQNPSHLYTNVGTYTITLIVVSNHGCIDSIRHPLEVQEYTFYIPNAFTPNNDGHNDFFFGQGTGITEYEMWIFDRWGNRIFYCKVNDLPQSKPCWWDGKVDGGFSSERVQEDVYVWKVNLINVFKKEFTYVGTVTVVR